LSQTNVSSFDLFVSYAQIAVFDGNLENPFNDWTEQHVHQGFAWREGSVSFKTLIEAGQTKVDFAQVQVFFPSSSALRSISVPFVCQEGARIEIATVTESRPIQLEAGEYQIIYETWVSEEICWCRFSVVRNGNLEPQILICDTDLLPSFPLLMHADPA
jgi:hypothetical protein